MPDSIEQETINKLTSVESVLKNPFKNLEDVLTQLGKINRESKQDIERGEEKRNFVDQNTVGARRESISIESVFDTPIESLSGILAELGKMFRVCQICGTGTSQEELISGVCIKCYHIREQVSFENGKRDRVGEENDLIPLKSRVGKLEAQVEDMKSKYQRFNSTPQDFMSEIVDEILITIRRDIQTEFNTMRNNLSFGQNTQISKSVSPTPPPPPSESFVADKKQLHFEIDFSKMKLSELKEFAPEFLESLPLSKRNQYNSRLKELQLIKQMTPKQRKEYFAKKKREKEQEVNFKNLKESLIKLEESDNSLFTKMRKLADKSVLAGRGTLGIFEPKMIYVNCYVCNKTNEILEGEIAHCKHCKTPLNVR
ncbi:MAG: hypothetical protein ACFE8U_00640 [Candidatus Hermodarchaeota archaeon]